MGSFKELLSDLNEVLQKYNPVNYKKLQEPLPEKEIDKCLEMLGVQDENFKRLYMWKNGVKKENGIAMGDQIFDFGVQVSLQYLVEGFDDTDFDLWAKNFIPIVMDGSGSALLFNNEKGKNYGRVHLYSVSLLHIEPISYYDSIEAMLETTIEAYEKKILQYDEKENWLNEDINRYYEIAAKNNPSSDYWKRQA